MRETLTGSGGAGSTALGGETSNGNPTPSRQLLPSVVWPHGWGAWLSRHLADATTHDRGREATPLTHLQARPAMQGPTDWPSHG